MRGPHLILACLAIWLVILARSSALSVSGLFSVDNTTCLNYTATIDLQADLKIQNEFNITVTQEWSNRSTKFRISQLQGDTSKVNVSYASDDSSSRLNTKPQDASSVLLPIDPNAGAGVTSSTGTSGPISTSPSCPTLATVDGTRKQCPSLAAPAAGAAVGGIICGLLAGIVGWRLLRKRQGPSAAIASRKDHYSDQRSPSLSPAMATLAWKDPEASKELQAANADAAFGSKFDVKSERDLVNQLSIFNEACEQFAMDIAGDCRAIGNRKAFGPLPRSAGNAGPLLATLKESERAQRFEDVARHLVNTITFQRLAMPFCFMGEPTQSAAVSSVSASVVKEFDQAQAARWRVMSHTAMRNASRDRNGQHTIKDIQAQIEAALAEALLWSGMETDASKAAARVASCFVRMRDPMLHLGRLVIDLREGMTSANYEINMSSTGFASQLGLVANPGTQSARALVQSP
ncbi:hypothetical protein OC835_005826 [Tilletia horrida]|nr:hypothetical protein OC835_005826 [Tilletia horrida]